MLSPEWIGEARQLIGEGMLETRVAHCLGVSRWSLNDALVKRSVYSHMSDHMPRSE